MRNIITQSTDVPARIGATYNPGIDLLRAFGWRDEPPAPPPVAEGYERGPVRLVEGDGIVGRWEYSDTRIQDRLDREAAAAAAAEAEAARLANIPVPMPSGIEVPVIVLTDAAGVGWGFVADAGDLISYQDHASPRPDQSEIARRISEVKATRATLRDDLKANKTALQALSVSSFTAAQKTQLNALIAEIIRLRKIVAQVVKGES